MPEKGQENLDSNKTPNISASPIFPLDFEVFLFSSYHWRCYHTKTLTPVLYSDLDK